MAKDEASSALSRGRGSSARGRAPPARARSRSPSLPPGLLRYVPLAPRPPQPVTGRAVVRDQRGHEARRPLPRNADAVGLVHGQRFQFLVGALCETFEVGIIGACDTSAAAVVLRLRRVVMLTEHE